MLIIGEKIKILRKQKHISQDVLASHLGVSFQAVSKWENGSTMPDLTMIPAIASYFGVSTEELFDYKVYETEKEVEAICNEAYKYRNTDRARAEQILRAGLQRYPGNDIILNHLLYTLDHQIHAKESIELCKMLIDGTKDDAIRYDAYRILATCFKNIGQYESAKATLEKIPEIYFSKLELEATLLEGEDKYIAAQKQKNLSAESLVNMLIYLGKHLKEIGESEKADIQFNIAKKVTDAFREDYLETKLFHSTVYESDKRNEIERLIS